MPDRKTFSRLIQCRTGHAHFGEYYKKFVPTEDLGCGCGLRTREHVLKECGIHARHRLAIEQGRHSQSGRLMGTVKGIRKLTTFTGAFEKAYLEVNEERVCST